jgi:hypothetical protein
MSALRQQVFWFQILILDMGFFTPYDRKNTKKDRMTRMTPDTRINDARLGFRRFFFNFKSVHPEV